MFVHKRIAFVLKGFRLIQTNFLFLNGFRSFYDELTSNRCATPPTMFALPPMFIYLGIACLRYTPHSRRSHNFLNKTAPPLSRNVKYFYITVNVPTVEFFDMWLGECNIHTEDDEVYVKIA